MQDRLMATRLTEVDDYKCYHLQMRMPMMISNRSIVTTFYEHETESGYRVVLHSSMGNEAQIESRRHHIGKDVIANNIITYMESKPYEGGMELNQVISLDIAGMIPKFVKTKIAKRLANVGLQIADYVMHGTIPEKAF